MIKFYGEQPPAQLGQLRPGGPCPACGHVAKFDPTSAPLVNEIKADGIRRVALAYACSLCGGSIAIEYEVSFRGGVAYFGDPMPLIRNVPAFDFEFVPSAVAKEIREALDCLSVRAFNGFAAVCRRAVQALCTDLGATASTKVQSQIESMLKETGLGEEWRELAFQVMLTGHDGSHPHLPEVEEGRCDLLLRLLQDLTYQLYTRPGKIKHASALRKAAQKPD